MQKIELISMTRGDLQEILNETMLKVIQLVREEQKEKAPPDWEELTLEQACIELSCCKRTLRRRMEDLKIKGLRIGRKITLQRKDLKKIRLAQ